MAANPDDVALGDVLAEAQEVGLVGPGPVSRHVDHACGFAAAVGSPPEGVLVDLGSGGGLPGLVLALHWPLSRWALVDGRTRSAEFLGRATRRLGLVGRVSVIEARAEVAAHLPGHRAQHRLVATRGFGPPAVAAECSAGFLAVGGRLVVSEPPGSGSGRWDTSGLAQVGLVLEAVHEAATGHFAVLRQVAPCPVRFPRRVGIPAKRPLF